MSENNTTNQQATQNRTPQGDNPSSYTGLTREDIIEILDEKLANLHVYVVESEITEAQQAIKSIVELSSF